jgi:hypothetical protein
MATPRRPIPAQNTTLKSDVEGLKQDMAKVGFLVDRLDATIDKLSEVASGVSHLLAVHESKIAHSDSILAKNTALFEARRIEVDEKIKDVYKRVQEGEQSVMSKFDTETDAIFTELSAMRKESTDQHNKLADRINQMERWMWMAVGAVSALTIIINNIPWDQIFG